MDSSALCPEDQKFTTEHDLAFFELIRSIGVSGRMLQPAAYVLRSRKDDIETRAINNVVPFTGNQRAWLALSFDRLDEKFPRFEDNTSHTGIQIVLLIEQNLITSGEYIDSYTSCRYGCRGRSYYLSKEA